MNQNPAFKERFRGHLALARVSNSPTVVSNVLAGAALAGVAWHPHIIPVAASMAMFYTAGMYLNDVCDYAIDCLERPDRPLVSGIVSRRVAAGIALLLFVLGCLVLITVSREAFFSGLVLVCCIVLYDYWHKGNPVGPLLMACNRALVYVTAYVAFQTEVPASLFWILIVVLAYVSGLTAIASFETKPGITQRWPMLLLLLPVVYFAWQIPPGVWWILLFLFAAWIGWSIMLVHKKQMARGITQLIAGIAVFDALILASLQLGAGAFVALAMFGLTLIMQRFVKGT